MKKHFINIAITLLLFAVPACSIPFAYGESSKRYYGDYDNNGSVDVTDARMALRTAVGLEKALTGEDFTCVDIDNDKSISVEDARAILRTAVGLEPSIYMNPSSAGDTAALLSAINSHRSSAGLTALTESVKLSSAAGILAEEFSATGNASLRPDSSYWFTAFTKIAVKPSYADAVFFKGPSDSAAAYSAFKADAKTVKNIEYNKYTQIGIACCEAADGSCYWCVIFAY